MQGPSPQPGRSDYLDFELEIGEGRGREYPVAVLRSPVGEARETMHFPFDELALDSRLDKLQIALLRSGGKHRKALSEEEQTVQNFGQSLFDTLFGGEIRSRYDSSLREAAHQDKGLRLKLRIHSPELSALPWEFMYDSRQAEYVCLSRRTPIVRYLESPHPSRPLTVTPPLRILGMVASPQDQRPLDVEREKQRVERAIQHLQGRSLVELEWLPGQTWRDLQEAMWGGPWHIFHFIGHGGFDASTDEGFIALANRAERTDCLSATRLGRLLADHTALRLVLLNSCEGAKGSDHDVFSSTASILVRRGIPAVLAMQYEITDRAAIEFARAFYQALAHSLAVDEAVVAARKAISLGVANTVEWGTPVLYMHAPDGVLFQMTEVPRAAPPPLEGPELPREDDAKREDSEAQQRQRATPSPKSISPRQRLPRWLLVAIGAVALIAVLVASGVVVWPIITATPTPTLTPLALDVQIREKDDAVMVYVPGGVFSMGSTDADRDAGDDEKPQHTVTLNAFWIDRTEVTNAQYARFLNALGTHKGKCGGQVCIDTKSEDDDSHIGQKGGQYVVEVGYENHPVIEVSWYGAQAYCEWVGARLPTEAEWERAARGGDGRIYPWGKDFDCLKGNFDDETEIDPHVVPGGPNCDGYIKTAPVGSYPGGASPYGVLDVAGNVWEWVADWYGDDYYVNSPESNPQGPSLGETRVMRGGSWYVREGDVRTAARHGYPPSDSVESLGFRCVRYVSEPAPPTETPMPTNSMLPPAATDTPQPTNTPPRH